MCMFKKVMQCNVTKHCYRKEKNLQINWEKSRIEIKIANKKQTKKKIK